MRRSSYLVHIYSAAAACHSLSGLMTHGSRVLFARWVATAVGTVLSPRARLRRRRRGH